ncbi:serine/threonine protein kinase [Planomonospora sphaerica]|uniref:Serine/threonine protein kinase n=1 Tax=Planomonospora sphaerica TaxID=161355 RepID=A0A171DPC7_9ACTN|nr:serine/threonine-protein kinase [Planomonospora sphaerica]GAT70908.1 serine/threonine protein kinase [Planomonospora sphaerica]
MNNLSPGDPLQIGRYRVLSRLGRGGMGTVYLGQASDGQRVALKVINSEYSQHEQFRMRFRREADAAQRVRRFCTAAVLEAALDGDQLYVVTEFVPGPNLEEAVRSGGPLRGSSLDALAVGVATALTAIHGAGVVHRDLKPSNVLLSPVGPRVIDFGIARALDTLSGVTGTGEIIGTPRYMAPEVLRGEPVSPACDVFSWGCLVAFAASGRAPFGGEALHAVLYQVLNTEPVLEGMETGLRELVARAMDKDPGRRPTAQQLLDHLVGRSAAPEQTAHSVQAVWQQSPPTLAEPAAWAGSGPGGPHVPGGSAGSGTHAVPGGPGAPTAPAAPSPYAVPGGPGDPTPAAGAGAHAVPVGSGGPWTQDDTRLPAGGEGGRGRAGGAPAEAVRRKKLIAGAAVAALVAAGGFGLYLVFSPSGPPTDLTLLYQDDFTQKSDWSGTYDPANGGKYGYAPEGHYAVDADGENAVQRVTAPVPFATAPPATPDPAASPTPTIPGRLLLGADVTVRNGSTGAGEYGLFCRGADATEATRYEFLIDTSGKARIRRAVKSAGGDLTEPAPVEVTKGKPVRLQAECSAGSEGMQLTMWVDGTRVQSVTDPDPLPPGELGMIVRVGESSGATLKTGFDNFTMRGAAPEKKP